MPSDNHHYCEHPDCKRSPVHKATWEGRLDGVSPCLFSLLKNQAPIIELFVSVNICNLRYYCDDHIGLYNNILYTVTELDPDIIWVFIGEAVIRGEGKIWRMPTVHPQGSISNLEKLMDVFNAIAH